MAASSSFLRPNPTGPQVFISFRGKDVRNHFISFLAPALREVNIKVFIDEDEFVSKDLVDLLKRIEESEIALVIFSEEYTSSDSCLDELAKIKERKDQGRLKVIPIFYKVEPSFVKHLKGNFGDHFRDLKRNHQHQPERTQKWEEALVSIPEIIGMPLAEQSDRTDREFIILMVGKIQKLLEYMRESPQTEADGQGGSMVPPGQPEREASRQGGSVMEIQRLLSQIALRGNPKTESNSQGGFLVPASRLDIAHPDKWTCSATYDRSYDRTDREFIISMVGKIHELVENMRKHPQTEVRPQGGSVIEIQELLCLITVRGSLKRESNGPENHEKWTWNATYNRPE